MTMSGRHVCPVVRVATWHNPMYTGKAGAGQPMCDRFPPKEPLATAFHLDVVRLKPIYPR